MKKLWGSMYNEWSRITRILFMLSLILCLFGAINTLMNTLQKKNDRLGPPRRCIKGVLYKRDAHSSMYYQQVQNGVAIKCIEYKD